MLIQGAFDEGPLIRGMLEREYAFSLEYEDGQEIRCAHHKGLWTYAHFKDKELVRAHLLDDSCEMPDVVWGQKRNPILEAFVKSQKELLERTHKDIDVWRELPARILYSLFQLLAGEKNRIRTVNVLQPGRNATVDMLTGDFDCSPRPEEFKK